MPAGGEGGGSLGHLFVCCGSDDETQAESLNLCISDELALLFISHHHILQPGTLSLSCQTPVPAAHTCSHVHTDPQTHSEAYVATLGPSPPLRLYAGLPLTASFVLSTSPHQSLHFMQ